MPRWTPETLWLDSDAIIIGGGESLHDFPWDILRGEMTIGCNVAYKLGNEICTAVLWSDRQSFKEHHDGLREFNVNGGPVFSDARKFWNDPPADWLYVVSRRPQGLYTDGIGWNGNVGAGAINLAFLLGCKRVYLLGFDMKRVDSRTHWHDEYAKDKKKRDSSYPRFLRSFKTVAQDWRAKFSDREIINVNDDSALKFFPMMSMEEFLAERRVA